MAIKKLGSEIKDFIDEHVVLKGQQQADPNSNNNVQPPVRIIEVPTKQSDTIMKLKEPNTFSGKHHLCHAFFSELTLIFAANTQRFANDHYKILYAISYMEGVVFTYMEPYLEEIHAEELPELLTNYKLFKETIIKNFGDSNPITSTEHTIRSLKQTGSVATYATGFRRLSMLLKWNGSALISQSELNLKDTIIKELARRPKCSTLLNELMSAAIKIDNLFYAIAKHSNNSSNNNQSRHSHNNFNYKNQTRNAPLRNHRHFNKMNYLNHNPQQRGPSNMASPMELGAINECKPLTPEVKEFRKVNNLCMYCGGKIHIALNCPNKKTEKQRSHHVASLASIYVAGRRGTTPSRGTKRPLSSEVHSYPIGRVHYAATSVHKNLLVFPATIFLQRKIH